MVDSMQEMGFDISYEASVLQMVAEASSSRRGFHAGVTCKEIGRALFFICKNSHELDDEDPLIELIKGWRLAEDEYDVRLQAYLRSNPDRRQR